MSTPPKGRLIRIAIGLGAAVLAMFLFANHSSSTNTPRPSVQGTFPWQPGATAAPKYALPTTDPNSSDGEQNYLFRVAADVNNVNTATPSAMTCTPNDAACIDQIRNVLSALSQFRSDLDSQPVPDCFKDLNGQLRSELNAYTTAATAAMDAVKSGSADALDKATKDVRSAVAAVNGTLTTLQAASCGGGTAL